MLLPLNRRLKRREKGEHYENSSNLMTGRRQPQRIVIRMELALVVVLSTGIKYRVSDYKGQHSCHSLPTHLRDSFGAGSHLKP
jgi:hypothetical protein